MKMEKIPLAQRLDSAAVVNARWLIGQYARLFCNDYFPTLDELMDTNYRGDLELASGRQLAVWLARLDETFPNMVPDGRAHLMYRYIVAPFTKLHRKGDIDHD